VVVICVLFVLPTFSPITVVNFNYTIVAVLVVLGGAWLYWQLSAKNWFTGPHPNIDEPPSGSAPDSPAAEVAPDGQ
jgi:hypothetical protein